MSTAVCANCATTLAPGARFCSSCGAPVEQQNPDVQRRVTTVLFADLVGFTTLSEARDAEEVRALLSGYFERCRAVVARYGGTIEKFIGDAVMAVWGVPTAHEDDAERAVRAGLDLVDAVAAFGEQHAATGLALRVGLVTGEVAATVGAVNQGMVAGDRVNTAARVQAAAGEGEVWVDEATRALSARAVEFTAAGTHPLKGKAEPVALFRAGAVMSGVAGGRRSEQLEAPLVGRRRELAGVKDALDVVGEDAAPRLLVVSGDAGVGKSRLAWELEKYADGLSTSVRWHWGRCLSYGDGVAYSALSEALRARLGLAADADPDVARQALHDAVAELTADPERGQWLETRLGVLLQATGEAHERSDLYAAWLTWFELLAADGSVVVLAVEDAQYADDATLDFLEHLATASRAPILVALFTRRELLERRPGIVTGRRRIPLSVEPLPAAAMTELVRALVRNLPDALAADLVARSDGLPLYAVETVRALLDRGLAVRRFDGRIELAADVDSDALAAAPTSLTVLLTSRLDALPAGQREVLDAAAVLGQVVTPAGLVALTGRPAAEIDELVQDMVGRDLLTRRDPGSLQRDERERLEFTQASVRGVAYRMQPRSVRCTRHLAAADFLETLPEAGGELAAVIATHLQDAVELSTDAAQRAAVQERLRTWWERSARRAASVGASVPASELYEQAADATPDPAAAAELYALASEHAVLAGRSARALALATRALDEPQCAPNSAVLAVRVYGLAHMEGGDGAVAAREALEAGIARLDLDRAVPTRRIELMVVTAMVAARTHDRERARELCTEALRLAERYGEEGLATVGMSFLGVTFLYDGVPSVGVTLIEQAAANARRLHRTDESVRAYVNLASVTITSDPVRAAEYAVEAFELGRTGGDVVMSLFALGNGAIARWANGDLAGLAAMERDALDGMDVNMPIVHLLAAVLDLGALARGETPAQSPDGPLTVPSDGREGTLWLRRAVQLRVAGRTSEATDAVARAIVELRAEQGVGDDLWLAWTLACDWLLELEDLDAARVLLDGVRGSDTPPLPALFAAEVRRIAGTIAALTGDSDDAEQELRAAIDALDGVGARPSAARARAALGRHLAAGGAYAAARPLLREARAIFADIGAAAELAALDRPGRAAG